jgi:hypothetical protein
MNFGNPGPILRARPFLLALAAALAVSGCAGGGGGGEFAISGINLSDGAIWKINRPIKISFSKAVDFSTVNLNTINIREVGGAPSAGEFYLESPSIVVFQPLCPTKDDLSDAGLKPSVPNIVTYELKILGVDESSPLTVKSTDGQSLAQSDTRKFTTPTSLLPQELFFDTTVGPPTAVIRTNAPGDNTQAATYVEIGGDPNNRAYFERDLQTGAITLDPPIQLPLNKLSDPSTHVALMLQLNQSVNPSSANVNIKNVRWEFENQQGGWSPLSGAVLLVANCTQTGSVVRIQPEGLLPPDTMLRGLISTQFTDIVGEVNLLVQDKFAPADSLPPPAPTANDPKPLHDEYLEEFATDEKEDKTAPFAEPHAIWGANGELGATFSFSGTGGPGANFDWKIATGQTVIFDTTNTVITGGPNFLPTVNQTVIGGVADVRDFLIEAGGVLRVQGPNPMTLLASGSVTINGLIDVSGSNTTGVVTLNTTFLPEPGAPGQAGGGKGGTGSPLTTASTPKGGNGFGAFNVPDLGGQGGESGWSNSQNVNSRRAAGGGGGRLGKNQPQTFGPVATFGEFDQTSIGLDAEPGFDNKDALASGAITGAAGPFGGAVGSVPFVDSDPANDFYGSVFDNVNQKLILGELKKPWAGGGGGAGGDASWIVGTGTWPPPWNPSGDEKGSGGGGGGGSFQVLSLGNIAFGPGGQIKCRGGLGGGGENSIYFDRLGGGSGGGSGGHVVLQTASKIDFQAVSSGASALLATGAQGGAGRDNLHGATIIGQGPKETPPASDACPPGYPTSGSNVCFGHWDGTGGDGGPGIIQMHTNQGFNSNPSLSDILTPSGNTTPLSALAKPTPLCPDASCRFIPVFGRTSRARSLWVALGNGGFEDGASVYKDVRFEFEGIEPVTGVVQTTAGKVTQLPGILGPVTLVAGPTPPFITPDGFTLVVSAAPLLGTTNEFYLTNLQLLKHFVVQLAQASAPTNVLNFDVASASYDSTTQLLSLTVDGTGPSLSSFAPGGAVTAALHPAFFRIASDGVPDSLPASAEVQIRFEATSADVNGLPVLPPLVPLTSNISNLNTSPLNKDLRFIRFEILFDIDALGAGLSPTSPIPAIDFLRIPFRY